MSERLIVSLFRMSVCLAFVSLGCSENSSPTAPSQPAAEQAAPVTPPPPPAPVPVTASVEASVNPNPVPFSGQPITDSAGCAGSKNTWFYDQILTETAGAGVTITGRIDKFDERVVNTLSNLSMAVPSKGSLTIKSRWCSAAGVAHTAQSTYTGTDANGHAITINGPVAALRSP